MLSPRFSVTARQLVWIAGLASLLIGAGRSAGLARRIFRCPFSSVFLCLLSRPALAERSFAFELSHRGPLLGACSHEYSSFSGVSSAPTARDHTGGKKSEKRVPEDRGSVRTTRIVAPGSSLPSDVR
jgi:hypothetical protein